MAEPTQLVVAEPADTQLPALREPGPPVAWEEEAVSLLDYLRILQARKWLLLSVAATVVFLVAVQVLTATPLYRSTTSLQVDPEGSSVLPYQDLTTSPRFFFIGEYASTQSEKLQTRSLVNRVIEKLGLVKGDPRFKGPVRNGVLTGLVSGARALIKGLVPRPSAGTRPADDETSSLATGLGSEIMVSPVRGTRLIEVSFDSPDPKLSQTIVRTVVEEFIGQHLEEKYDATISATEFLREQLHELRIKVERSEVNLLSYARAKGIINLSERENVTRKRMADLSDELTRVEGDLIVKAARQAAAQAHSEQFPEVLSNPELRGLETLVLDGEAQLAALSSRFGPSWPAVKEAQSKIAELRQQIDIGRSRARGAAVAEYRLVLDNRDRLVAALAEQVALVDRLDEDSIQYNIQAREVETNKALYEGLLQRLKEAGVAAGLESTNIRIVDAASLPTSAVSPKKTRSLVLALVVGLALGVGAVLLAETLDNSLKTSDDIVDLLGLPALGVVPTLGLEEKSRMPRFSRKAEAAGPVRSIFALSAIREGTKNLGGSSWEAYRALRTALLLSHSGQPPQTILVTSALPGEGKTTTATNLAIAMAQTGNRTLLLELDLRRPAMAEIFELALGEGMSTYLTGNTDLSSQIRETGIQNLFLLPAGPRPPNPPELLDSDRMQSALDLMKEHFTYIIIDSPPTLQLSDVLVVGRTVDGVILVVRSGETPRQAVRRAAEHLLQTGSRILGVLLNDVDVRKSSYGYGYRYGYGYGRSDSYASYHTSATDS